MGSRPLRICIEVFILAVDAMMAFMRSSGSAMCVPSSTRLMLTWLPGLAASLAPASRRETGMAATMDLAGTPP